MLPPTENRFEKTLSCPSSETLSAYSDEHLVADKSIAIEKHLAACDFCSMELEIYNRFPLASEKVETPLMPRQLYNLAKALLSGNSPDVLDLTGTVG